MGCRGCNKARKRFKDMSEEEKNPIEVLKDDINYLNRIKKGEYLKKLLEKKEKILEKMQPEPKEKK